MGPSKQETITPKEFYQQLGEVGGPDLVAFARWVIDNASAHRLNVVCGSTGPLLKFAHQKRPSLPISFGQLDKGGLLSQRQTALFRHCEELHIPIEVIQDYLNAVAALIPGACVKVFPLAGGDTKELIVAGKDAGPVDWPPLAPLALQKEAWFAAIDRVIERICQVLDKRPDYKGRIIKPAPGDNPIQRS
jgi:hypothetical protein